MSAGGLFIIQAAPEAKPQLSPEALVTMIVQVPFSEARTSMTRPSAMHSVVATVSLTKMPAVDNRLSSINLPFKGGSIAQESCH